MVAVVAAVVDFADSGMGLVFVLRVILLNPVGTILEAINDAVVLNRAPNPYWLFYAVSWALGSFVFAWIIFDKAEPAFAESI